MSFIIIRNEWGITKHKLTESDEMICNLSPESVCFEYIFSSYFVVKDESARIFSEFNDERNKQKFIETEDETQTENWNYYTILFYSTNRLVKR